MKNQKCSRCSRATPAAWYCKKFQCTVADDEMGSCDSYREDDSEPEALDAARRSGRAEGLREANEKHARLLAAAKALLDEIEWQNDRPFTSRVKFERYRELDAAAALLARAEEVECE